MSIWGCVRMQTKPKVLSHAFPRVPNGINVAVGSKQCSPLVAIIYRKWVGANLITIPSYVATVYPHVINVPRNRTQTKQGTGAWTGSAVTLGTSVLGCTTYPREPYYIPVLYETSPRIYGWDIDIYIYIIHIYIYIYIFVYNYAYVCKCFWVINMYKPSSNWDAPPSMADSSAI